MLEGRLLPLQLRDFALQGRDQRAGRREIVDVAAAVIRHAVIIRDADPRYKILNGRSRDTLIPSATASPRNVDAGEQQCQIGAAPFHRRGTVLHRPGEGAAFKALV